MVSKAILLVAITLDDHLLIILIGITVWLLVVQCHFSSGGALLSQLLAFKNSINLRHI